MDVVAVIILIVWVVFWIYWLASAFRVKAGRTRWGRFVGSRIAIGLLAILVVRADAHGGQTITNDPLLEGFGLAIVLLGLAVAVWARLSLGVNWGMPMSEKVDPEIVETGPYRKVRHPIYSGIILAMVGTAVGVSWYYLIAAGLIGTYFVYSAVMEERYMTGVFPEAYPAYKRSTKLLIPFIV